MPERRGPCDSAAHEDAPAIEKGSLLRLPFCFGRCGISLQRWYSVTIMLRPLLVTAWVVLLAGLPCQALWAQSASQSGPDASLKVREVPAEVAPRPFSPDSSSPSTSADGHQVLSIEFRPSERLTPGDRLLVADAESSIAERAARVGYDLSSEGWAYDQILCPALPGHLFLRYARNGGKGDVTLFSASIPRTGEGRVRIIPILKRSYSLFSPAPVNAMTIAAFNHVRAEEAEGQSNHWLGNALCYAALAGANPEISTATEQGTDLKPSPDLGATLFVAERGGEVIRFDAADAAGRPMQWTMIFSPKGQLVKATHVRATMVQPRLVPQTSAVSKTWTVPQASQP